MRTLGGLLVVAILALSGCGSSAGGPAGEPSVFAAASLNEAFRRIAPRARFSFAGSDQLAFQIEQGAPADVFASASPVYAEALTAKGLLLAPRVFASNRLVVVVPRSNPAGIRSIDDLARPGVKLVIGDRQVPIGIYSRTVLSRLGLGAALANVVSDEQDAKAVVAKVALGEADAGMVYLTDVGPARDEVTSIAIPATAQPVIEYVVAVVRGATHRASADAFVRRLLTAPGRAALARAGFGLPSTR